MLSRGVFELVVFWLFWLPFLTLESCICSEGVLELLTSSGSFGSLFLDFDLFWFLSLSIFFFTYRFVCGIVNALIKGEIE